MGWRVIGASVQGAVHRRQALPCRDAYGYRILPDGPVLIAVAKGFGEASCAPRGGAVAVLYALNSLEVSLSARRPAEESEWLTPITLAFHEASRALLREAETIGLPLGRMAAALTCVVLGEEMAAVGQIGSTQLFARDTAGGFFPLCPRHSPTDRALIPDFVPSSLEWAFFPHPVQALALMTETPPLEGESLGQFLERVWDEAAQAENETKAEERLLSFLATEPIFSRIKDDTTLVLAVRTSRPSPPEWREAVGSRRRHLEREVARYVHTLTEHRDPERIILFGSLATGRLHPWSDVDIVVVEETEQPFWERIRQMHRLLRPSVGADILVYTPEEFDRLSRERPFFYGEILARGKVLYERNR